MAASGKAYLKLNDGTLKALAVGGGTTSGGSGSSFTTDFYGTASGDTSLNNGVYTKINFDTATRDTNSEFDTGTDKWVCSTSGTYIINAGLRFANNATGYRNIFVVIDGDTTPTTTYLLNVSLNNGSGFSGRVSITISVSLTASQTVEIYGYQNSGGALNCTATGSFFQIWRIA